MTFTEFKEALADTIDDRLFEYKNKILGDLNELTEENFEGIVLDDIIDEQVDILMDDNYDF